MATGECYGAREEKGRQEWFDKPSKTHTHAEREGGEGDERHTAGTGSPQMSHALLVPALMNVHLEHDQLAEGSAASASASASTP